MVAVEYMVPGSYHIEDFFHLDYYSMSYSTYALGFCYSTHAIGFDEPESGEATDVEELETGHEVVVDTGTIVAGIRQQQHRDMGSMA